MPSYYKVRCTVICLILTINHVTESEVYLFLGEIMSQNGECCYEPMGTALAEIGSQKIRKKCVNL